MKKLLLALSISLAFSNFALAETEFKSEPATAYWESIDKNYADQMSKIDIKEASAIENEKYSTQEERYVAGLFFYGDKSYGDKKRAFNQFKIAHKMGFTPASFMYGKMLITGESLGNRNLYLGRNILSSISGDKYYEYKANSFLADQYLQEKDFNSAISAYKKLNSRDSVYKIAKVYEYEGEKEKAYLLYKQAVADGYIEAKIDLAKRLLSKEALDTKKAISLLTEVAEKGKEPDKVSEAQTLLGDIYFNGNQDMYADVDKAVWWYKKAANNNYDEAMIKLHAVYVENEKNDKYRLGKNKDYIHDLSEKIYKKLY